MKNASVPFFAGIALLVWLTPRDHPAALWKVAYDGEQSQMRVREISSALGVDTQGWNASVTGDTDSHAGVGHLPRFSPVFAKVALVDPMGPGRILARVSASGDVNRWEWKGYPKTTAPHAPSTEAIARNALVTMLSSDSVSFRALPETGKDEGARVVAFDRTGESTEHFEATVTGGRLVKAELTPVWTHDVDDAVKAQKKYLDWFEGAVGVAIDFLGILLATCVYVFWAVRRAVRHRFVLAFSSTAALWGIVNWTNWLGYDQRFDSIAENSPLLEEFLPLAAIGLLLVLLLMVLAGATDAIGLRPKAATLRSIFSSAAWNRQAGTSLLVGLLCGPLLAALPLAISALHLAGSRRTGDYEAGLMYALHPTMQALNVMASPALLGLFGFGAGFLRRYIRKGWLANLLLIIPGILLLAVLSVPTESSPAAFLLSGALLFAVYHQLFFRVDLLAVLSAGWCARVLWNASAEALQPAATIHSSGVTAFAFLGVAAGVAALVAWRGMEMPEEDGEAPAVVTSQRESLMREFSIAHRVQQHMLPARPPQIPSCTVSASCHPAQEVGGDLFDFLQLPDGRWSIGVGDVSGKGVHAALYMTLTKGLLAATTQDSSDLLEIMGNVNGHVHAATERKTFVTMAFGAFDPETRAFDHVRAGHNPIVWRSPARGETSLLNAPGLGLGIVSDRLFRRSLRRDTLQLNAGDALVFYSDGVTEAMNAEKEQFGEERLMRSVEQADGKDAGEVREQILADVRHFLNGETAQDDMTIVVLRVN